MTALRDEIELFLSEHSNSALSSESMVLAAQDFVLHKLKEQDKKTRHAIAEELAEMEVLTEEIHGIVLNCTKGTEASKG